MSNQHCWLDRVVGILGWLLYMQEFIFYHKENIFLKAFQIFWWSMLKLIAKLVWKPVSNLVPALSTYGIFMKLASKWDDSLVYVWNMVRVIYVRVTCLWLPMLIFLKCVHNSLPVRKKLGQTNARFCDTSMYLLKIISNSILFRQLTTKELFRLCECILFAYGTNRFSHDVAQISKVGKS